MDYLKTVADFGRITQLYMKKLILAQNKIQSHSIFFLNCTNHFMNHEMSRNFQILSDNHINVDKKDFIKLIINEFQIECSKDFLMQISMVANKYFTDNPNANEMKIDIKEQIIQEDIETIIKSLFQNESIEINSQNDLFFKELSQKLQIQSLEDIAENWEIYELQEAEEVIFNIDENILPYFNQNQSNEEEEFESENNQIRELFEKANKVGKETFCRIIINACIARWKLINVYLKLIHFMSIESIFCRILLHQMEMFDGIFSIREEKSQTICYLARYFYDKKFIKAKKIISIFQTLPFFFADLSQHPFFSTEENRLAFQKLVSEGVNPSPILAILRNDDVDSFQKVACLPTFNINEYIKPSDFEKCDFINNKQCTYIEFCAFVDSIKCFKFIYINQEANKSDDLIKYAIAGGNVEIVHLCEQIGSISFKETREIAVKFHRWEIFEWLFEHKFHNEVKGEDDDIFSFLFQSLQFSNFTTLSYVLYNDADYNYALPFTIDHDNVLYAKWLIKHKEKLFKEETTKSAIKNLLHYACRNENVDMLKLLLSQKEYNNVNSKYDGKPPIVIAIEKENFELYKTLIDEKKIKLNMRDFSGKQVIHFACEYKNIKILEHLLQNKRDLIDINSCDKTNNTPLHLACENGNLKTVQMLFNYYNNDEILLNIKNKQNKTPLMMSCLSERKKKRLPLISLIYEHIKEEDKEKILNEKGPMKKTILHLACENREFEIVRYLSSLPTIDINSVDEDNRTALMVCVFYGFVDIFQILINHPQIDVKIKDKTQKNAYDIAISRSFDAELTQIIKEKIDQ